MPRNRETHWYWRLLGITLVSALGLAAPGAAFAADRKPFVLQPVAFDGTKFTGEANTQLAKDYPNGVKKGEKDSATVTVPPRFHDGKAHNWGSVGLPKGSFLENGTGKPICTITITTSGDLFSANGNIANGGWDVAVSPDQKTITFTAKEAKYCIQPGDYFWFKVPESPQPNSGDTPTLKGTLALADTPADTGDAVAAVPPGGIETVTPTAPASATNVLAG
jgi:hypothetical protein